MNYRAIFRFQGNFVILISITFVLVLLAWNYDIVGGHDSLIHIGWGYFWNKYFIETTRYHKWFDDAFGGLGSPSFIFYPPLFRLLSSPFAFFGANPVQQVRGALSIVFICNSIGTFKLSRTLFQHNSFASNVAIFIGLLNPYFLLDIFRRGAWAEALAISIIPWMILGVKYALEASSTINLLPVAFCFFALSISHLPSLLIVTFTLYVSLILLLLFRKITLRYLVTFMIAMISGCLCASFFILPCLVDINLVRGAGFESIENTFLLRGLSDYRNVVSNLIALKIRFYESDFQLNVLKISTLYALMFLVSLICILRKGTLRKAKSDSKIVLILVMSVMVAVSFFMLIDLSLPIYKILPIFRKIQFPWRFMIIVSALIPYLIGYVNSNANTTVFNSSYRWRLIRQFVSIFLMVLMSISASKISLRFSAASFNTNDDKIVNYLLSNSYELDVDKVSNLGIDLDASNNWSFKGKSTTGFAFHLRRRFDKKLYRDKILPENTLQAVYKDVLDYIPTKAVAHLKSLSIQKPIQTPLTSGSIEVQVWSPDYRRLSIDTASELTIDLGMLYYPGWHIKTNPKLSDVGSLSLPSEKGLMQLQLPTGNYEVEIFYRGTTAERLGTIISTCSFILILIGIVKTKQGRAPLHFLF